MMRSCPPLDTLGPCSCSSCRFVAYFLGADGYTETSILLKADPSMVNWQIWLACQMGSPLASTIRQRQLGRIGDAPPN